jgi:hypothetical protein
MSNAQPSGNTAPNGLQGYPFYYDGPSIQGLSFLLQSTNGSPDHTLKIGTQASLPFELASITGTWQGKNAGSVKSFTGTITKGRYLYIACSWANGMSGMNTLSGTLVLKKKSPNAVLPEWFLQGAVTATDQNGMVVPGGPGDVSGYASPLLQS